MVEGTKFGVIIGNGIAISRQGICRRMELVLTEVTIKTDFIATNLGQLDIILGILWLCWTGFMGDTLVIEIAPIYDGK